MADLCPVIAFQGGRSVEQGREQVLLDIPYLAARFLHAVKNILDVVAGPGFPEACQGLCQGLIDQSLMDQDLIGQYLFHQFLEIQLLFVPHFPGVENPWPGNPQPGFPGVEDSGSVFPGQVLPGLVQQCSILLFPRQPFSRGIPESCIPYP